MTKSLIWRIRWKQTKLNLIHLPKRMTNLRNQLKTLGVRKSSSLVHSKIWRMITILILKLYKWSKMKQMHLFLLLKKQRGLFLNLTLAEEMAMISSLTLKPIPSPQFTPDYRELLNLKVSLLLLKRWLKLLKTLFLIKNLFIIFWMLLMNSLTNWELQLAIAITEKELELNSTLLNPMPLKPLLMELRLIFPANKMSNSTTSSRQAKLMNPKKTPVLLLNKWSNLLSIKLLTVNPKEYPCAPEAKPGNSFPFLVYMNRDIDLSVLEEVILLFETKFVELNEYVRDRVMHDWLWYSY